MLKRHGNLLWHYDGPAPAEAHQLEREGHCVLRGVFGAEELGALRADIAGVYERHAADLRDSLADAELAAAFRYQMLNRSALCQQAMAHPRILAVVEPLLGGDCHAVNSTAWRNPPGATDPSLCYWHIDGGPHVPRPAGVEWPVAIPYPVFVIASHIYLAAVALDDGPTTVIPTSHRSGQPPPFELRFDERIEYDGHGPVSHLVAAGDVGFFVSDVWHRRRLPTERAKGRFFLQTNYGRRDLAQRLLPSAESNQTSAEARARARSERERTLIGLHPPAFYDG